MTAPITYTPYAGEAQLPAIIRLIENDLSEPYSIYTYRYFLHAWPHLTLLASSPSLDTSPIGVVIAKLEAHRDRSQRGYIGMIAVAPHVRGLGVGRSLAQRSIQAMIAAGADEIVLETECHNEAALGLYESLGFVREKRMARYYLNGVDAFRLKLWITSPYIPGTLTITADGQQQGIA